MAKHITQAGARMPIPPGITYERVRDRLIEAVQEGEGAAWTMGREWAYLINGDLWKAHYESAGDFLRGEFEERGIDGPSASELSRRARVATTFSQAVAEKLGIDRLDRALTYWAHRRNSKFSRDDPGSEEIEIPLPDGSKITKTLSLCTQLDMKAANAAFATGEGGGLGPRDAVLEKVLQGALKTLVGSQGRGSVHLKRRGDKLVLGLSLETPLDRFGSLLEALKALPIGKAKGNVRARLH